MVLALATPDSHEFDETVSFVYPLSAYVIQKAKMVNFFQGPHVLRPLRGVAGEPGQPRLTGVGAFQLSAYYDKHSAKLSRRQFSGKADLYLHDSRNGFAAVAIGDVGMMSLAYVRSTGHDVLLAEPQRLNLLVPVAGTLSSENENEKYVHTSEPWVLFGRGSRKTTVKRTGYDDYEAFVLSVPPDCVGEGLQSLEQQGGMLPADPSNMRHWHLAELTRALATQVCISEESTIKRHLADAWTTLLYEELSACLETHFRAETEVPSPVEITDAASRYVRAAEAIIYDPTIDILSPRDIAQRLSISERTLQTAFRKVRGVTPIQVVSAAKLHRARQALLDPAGPETVAGVCRMCGIDHHGRFSNSYKQVFGELPSVTLNSRPLRKL